jgi:uncharacterized protein YkwD
MIKRRFLTFLLVVIAAVSGKNVFAQSTAKGNEMTAEIMQYVNEYRAKHGLSPLRADPAIAADAEIHSRNMAAGRVPFGHDGFNERVTDLGHKINSLSGCAENVAAGEIDAKEAVHMWLNSPGHKKNIEGNYNLSGIGVAKGSDGQLYFTQIFVRKG